MRKEGERNAAEAKTRQVENVPQLEYSQPSQALVPPAAEAADEKNQYAAFRNARQYPDNDFRFRDSSSKKWKTVRYNSKDNSFTFEDLIGHSK